MLNIHYLYFPFSCYSDYNYHLQRDSQGSLQKQDVSLQLRQLDRSRGMVCRAIQSVVANRHFCEFFFFLSFML